MKRTLHGFCILALWLGWVSAVLAVQVEVHVEGVDKQMLDNVRAFLSIEKESKDPQALESRIRRLHELAPQQIRRALQPFGYYQASVTSHLEIGTDKIIARYRIDPGPAVNVAMLDVQLLGEGRDNPELRERLTTLPIKQGRVLSHADYEKSKQLLQQSAREQGYLDARLVQHSVKVELTPYRATVTLHLATGQRYYFGPVTFSQEGTAISESLLQRYVPFKPGDPYTSTHLLQLHAAMSNSGYFASVEVTPRKTQRDGSHVPVEVKLQPTHRDRYKVGIGYGTDTGARLSLDYWRLLNTHGHTFTSDLKLSEKLNSAFARYHIPLKQPATEQLSFAAGFKDEESESRISRISQISVQRSGLRRKWREVLGLTYEIEDYELGILGDETTLFYPKGSWMRTRSNDLLYPTHGDRVRLEVLGAAEGVLSDVTFIQARATGKWVRSFGERNRVIARGEVGATWLDNILDLPASKRFYAGGDQSVRGFGYEELGPRDATGAVIGGKYLMVGSLEYERQLHGKWSAALFYDIGNAGNGLDMDFARGAGFGVRWRSPVGPVRVDFAWAVSEPGSPFQLHVVIGPEL